MVPSLLENARTHVHITTRGTHRYDATSIGRTNSGGIALSIRIFDDLPSWHFEFQAPFFPFVVKKREKDWCKRMLRLNAITAHSLNHRIVVTADRQDRMQKDSHWIVMLHGYPQYDDSSVRIVHVIRHTPVLKQPRLTRMKPSCAQTPFDKQKCMYRSPTSKATKDSPWITILRYNHMLILGKVFIRPPIVMLAAKLGVNSKYLQPTLRDYDRNVMTTQELSRNHHSWITQGLWLCVPFYTPLCPCHGSMSCDAGWIERWLGFFEVFPWLNITRMMLPWKTYRPFFQSFTFLYIGVV